MMESIGADRASVFLNMYFDEIDKQPDVDTSKLMRLFLYNNKVNGLPVLLQAKRLPLNTFALVENALLPHYTAKVWTGYISPLKSDLKALAQYGLIKQRQISGLIFIVSLLSQFCPSLNKFLILITYYSGLYKLKADHQFLKEQDNGSSTFKF